jgi:SAM-dependent methyltransferase
VTTAAERWRDELAAWEIPPEILAQAPEPPWGFPVEMFRAAPEPSDTVSRSRALEALPAGGTVLDVGCGGGAAGLALVPPAGLVIGVDSGPGMLASFAAAAEARGVAHREVEGTWPDVAGDVPPVDVVVCHHVLYNVADLAPFVDALTNAARRRVVVELTVTHPLTLSAPLWRHFHGLERPDGPNSDLAVEALRENGIEPAVERWSRPPRDVPREIYVKVNRLRLCLPASADEEIERVMGETNWPREVVTIWWDVARPPT